jgi:N-acetylmuramoyl-L-alanine amidase
VAKELGLKDLGTRKQVLVGFQHAQVPAVLVEVAYLSNPAEEKLLADPAFRQRAAQGMYSGITQYLTAKQ